MSIYQRPASGGSGSTVDLTPVLSAIESKASQASVDALATAGSFPGEVVLVANSTGQAPAGHERISGFAPASSTWAGMSKIQLLPSRAIPFNSSHVAGGLFVPTLIGPGTMSGLRMAVDAQRGAAFFAVSGVTTPPVAAYSFMTGAWQAVSSLPSTAAAGAMLVAGGKLYSAFGYLSSAQPGLLTYDSEQDAWVSLSNPPPAVLNFPLFVEDSAGRLVSAGGLTTASYSSVAQLSGAVYRYTPATNSWETLSALSPRFARPVACARINGTSRYLVHFQHATLDGSTALGFTSAPFVFDADALTLTQTEALPEGYSAGLGFATEGPSSGTAVVAVVVNATVPPNGASAGLLYDENLPVGSRWQAYDLGEPVFRHASYSSQIFSAQGGPCAHYNGHAFVFSAPQSASSLSYAQPAMVRIDEAAVSTGAAGAFYARKT